MKKILVTGGAGFIGSNFVRYLLNKYPQYQVMVLDCLTYAGNPENFGNGVFENPRFSFWYGNVCNPDVVNTLVSQSDIVVHMAAETHVARSIYDNSLFFQTDVLGTQIVANAVLKNPNVQMFVHISTSEVYGTALYDPMTEDHPLNPTTPYAAAKTGADRLVYSYFVTYGIPAVIVRPFNNYGPYQHLEKVIPRFVTSALHDEPLTIHGDGKSSRDWLYVEDHCEALDKIIHADIGKIKGEGINLCTNTDINIETVAEIVLTKLGKTDKLLKRISERPGQVQRHVGSNAKALDLLGWSPRTSFEAGIDKTIQWYKDNPDWWHKLHWMKTVPIRTADGTIEYH